ncbi:VP1 [Orungo virus]|uniref:RNA-directed RNA polymerase n=2 Tax=Orungo virus TaxID=40058 RepID=W5QLX5_9REOV|nr:VP1 [Orungo virus]AFX73387.1 VP1 [Orungo virus]
MVITVEGAWLVRRALQRFLKFSKIDGESAVYEFYRYSSNIREIRRKHGTRYKMHDEELERRRDSGKLRFKGMQVVVESTWMEILGKGRTTDEIEIFRSSILSLDELNPEEEFLRNYASSDKEHPSYLFVRGRAVNEMQIYGDMPIKAWLSFLVECEVEYGYKLFGMEVARSFVQSFGSPFHQNSRDLSQIDDMAPAFTSPLLFEMCCMTSILEINIRMRMLEERVATLKFGEREIDPLEVLKEFFRICIPHPKKINNMLRAPYSWFVKLWGVSYHEPIVLTARGGEDKNSKDIFFTGFHRVKNPYSIMLKKSRFFKKSLDENISKVKEAIDYSNSLTGMSLGLPVFLSMLQNVYDTEFNPTMVQHVLLASFLLSIQTITGYGRAWVKNVSSDNDTQMRPAEDNFIDRVAKQTEINFIQAYEEALGHGEDIVKPEDMFTSILRLARNTSSGFSTAVDVYKRFGPKSGGRGERVKITSRIKALVIFTKGHEIFTAENLAKRYDTEEDYQTKGSRDVPIKATRTIYSINLSILIPQLILTLPLNEYFARFGGSTAPDSRSLGGKVIIGDLEATGSRTIDAADTFRNSSDPEIFTIAIDYSDYDQHLTVFNFRNGMLEGIRSAMKRYKELRYDGYTLNELIEFGYGEGRIVNSKWNGKRRVKSVRMSDYMALSESQRAQGTFKPPQGVRPVSSMQVFDSVGEASGGDTLLISPTDGSDLATVNTHLSGENSTLVANSLHNMAIGRIIQEEIRKNHRAAFTFESEQYVGDDTLLYAKLNTLNHEIFDKAIDTIFDTVGKCGHVASAAKTLIAPFSVEKTQTHAKQGIYIAQDRMMIISSERRKDIEDVQGYMRSQVSVMATKVSRGFSHELAQLVFMMKSSIVGFRKLKRTVVEDGVYRDRALDSEDEDGFTLMQIRDPLVAFYPAEWNGYGMHPVALNIVMTEDMFIDTSTMVEFQHVMRPLLRFMGRIPPVWNETKADKRQISSITKMSFFSKMARPAVRAVLANSELSDQVRTLPLGDFSPFNLSATMMHSALLKEPRARALLTPAYEKEFQSELNSNRDSEVNFVGRNMEINTNYMKLFDVDLSTRIVAKQFSFPDQNMSLPFYFQKLLIGHRPVARMRMTYIDRIDQILRGDVVMRGFITANTIMSVLEKIGTAHAVQDLTTIFQLMNIESKVAHRLAEYIASERVRFDALSIAKRGICGDEFSMSLDVCTERFAERFMELPAQFTKTERDIAILYAAQLTMLRCAANLDLRKIKIGVSADHVKRFKQRQARFKTHLPKMRTVTRLITPERISARLVQHQFT